MSNRKIINAAATGGIGYYPVVGASDPYYDKVSLLLNGDTDVDTNFSNVSLLLTGNDLLDKSNNKATITNTGTVTVSNTVKKFGTGSLSFSGSNYLTSASNQNIQFDTGNFTVEFWINASASGSYNQVIGTLLSGTEDGTWRVGNRFASSNIMFFARGNGSGYDQVQYAINVNDGTWHHIACVRQSGVIYMYVDGIAQTPSAGSASIAGTCTSSNSLYAGYNTRDASYLVGYIDDLRITKGIARYTANFTPPTQALPSHEILDSSVYRLPITTTGNARIDTTTKKFGTGAMYFDGYGDYVSVPNSSATSLGTSDFTLELWYRPVSRVSSFPRIICKIESSEWTTNTWYLNDRDGNSATTKFAFGVNNIGVNILVSTTTVVDNTWYYLTVSRSGNTFYLFVNGVLEATYTSSASVDNSTSGTIGIGGSGGYNCNGYIDDFRFTKGFCRYTANFTPPSASLPTIPPTISADPWWGNVSLLLDGNTTDAYDPYWQNVSLMLTGDDFIDWSNQHNAITNNGTVTLSTNKKYNASAYSFSGSNYLTIPTNSALNFSAGDFTIEAWVNLTNTPSNDFFIISSSGSGGLFFGHASVGAPGHSTYGWGYGRTAVAWDYISGTTATIGWNHIALTRSGTNIKLFVNGSQVGTTQTSSQSYDLTTTSTTVGSQGAGYYITGYIADLRVTKGIARTITVPTAALPAFKIQDRTQNNLTLTPYGNVQLSTDVKKNGTGSMFFDGTGDYLTIPMSSNLQLGSGQFTVECWFYANSISGTNTALMGCYRVTSYPSNTAGWDIIYQSSTITFRWGSPAYNDVGQIATTANQWHHVAVVNAGSNIKMFLDGIQVASITTNATVTDSAESTLWIGWAGSISGTTINPFNGYIDDLRITKGYARYTQNFTPPSQSFATQYISTGFDPNYADVSLLLTGEGTNGSTTFTDLSSSPKTITAYGNAKISTAVKKYGTGAIYNPGDGTGNYLTIASNSLLDLAGDKWTIEMWVYPTTATLNNRTLFSKRGSGGCSYQGYVRAGTNNIGFYNGTEYDTGVSFTANVWCHIAYIYDGSTVKIYKDGTQIFSSAIAASANNSYPLYVGTYLESGFNLEFPGYIDDLRITKGIARYTTNFTPPTYQLPTDTTGTVIDPLRSSTSLLLRGNGTNGSTSFTDESPNGLTVTNNGSVTVNTATKKYGTGSMAFSGSNTLVTNGSGIVLGTGDFTIECWVYPTVVNSDDGVWSLCTSTAETSYQIAVGIYNSAIFMKHSGGANLFGTTTLAINTWYHIAVSRILGTMKVFINGVQESSVESTYDYTASYALLGTYYSSGCNLNGYIDDLRITKGYARYTSNFTPPTYEDPIVTGTQYDYNYAQVSLLLNGDGTNGSQVFTDLSSMPKAITTNGNAQISTGTKKYGTGSLAFDGDGDYLSLPSSSILPSGTEDFTIELWLYFTNSAGRQAIMSGTTTNSIFIIKGSDSAGDNNISVGLTLSSTNERFPVTFLNSRWYNLVAQRASGVISFYLDGVKQTVFGSGVGAANLVSSSSVIGYSAYAPIPSYLNGYIDDLRITKGVARYTTSFTPPTAPLPTSGGY